MEYNIILVNGSTIRALDDATVVFDEVALHVRWPGRKLFIPYTAIIEVEMIGY